MIQITTKKRRNNSLEMRLMGQISQLAPPHDCDISGAANFITGCLKEMDSGNGRKAEDFYKLERHPNEWGPTKLILWHLNGVGNPDRIVCEITNQPTP